LILPDDYNLDKDDDLFYKSDRMWLVTLLVNDVEDPFTFLEDVVNKLKNEMLVLEIAHDLDRILQADLIVFICENKIKVFNYTSDFLNDDQVRKVWKTDDRI
jgi:ABC-type hemin transport system ATPase subunit